MAGVSVEHINPFLESSTNILKQMCKIDAQISKPYIKEPVFLEDTLVIIIGFTGEKRGQVMIALESSVACDISSKMMMMPVTEMDEMSKSAISELGNMIMGNTATIFSEKGVSIDITPPTLGKGTMSFSTRFAQNICIPLIYDKDKIVEVNIAIESE